METFSAIRLINIYVIKILKEHVKCIDSLACFLAFITVDWTRYAGTLSQSYTRALFPLFIGSTISVSCWSWPPTYFVAQSPISKGAIFVGWHYQTWLKMENTFFNMMIMSIAYCRLLWNQFDDKLLLQKKSFVNNQYQLIK